MGVHIEIKNRKSDKATRNHCLFRTLWITEKWIENKTCKDSNAKCIWSFKKRIFIWPIQCYDFKKGFKRMNPFVIIIYPIIIFYLSIYLPLNPYFICRYIMHECIFVECRWNTFTLKNNVFNQSCQTLTIKWLLPFYQYRYTSDGVKSTRAVTPLAKTEWSV